MPFSLPGDSRQAGSWSQCELYVAIICACLPVLRVVIITLGHRYLGWSMVGSAIGGNDKPKGSGSGGAGHSTGASASASRRAPRLSQSRHNHVVSASAAAAASDADVPRGDFIRLDDLENGPASRDGDGDGGDDEQCLGEKNPAGKAASRNTIIVTRKVSIRSDV